MIRIMNAETLHYKYSFNLRRIGKYMISIQFPTTYSPTENLFKEPIFYSCYCGGFLVIRNKMLEKVSIITRFVFGLYDGKYLKRIALKI